MAMSKREAERFKRVVLTDYAKKFGTRIFVETGTYKGDTVKAMLVSGLFDQIFTVDIYEDRVEKAKLRFFAYDKVHCIHGDSAVCIKGILDQIDEPALFWLDAHHSGKQIARKKGLIETPILAELTAILNHSFASSHVILVDDYRYMKLFGGQYENYPTEDELREIVLGKFPNWEYEVKNDILRIHAKT